MKPTRHSLFTVLVGILVGGVTVLAGHARSAPGPVVLHPDADIALAHSRAKEYPAVAAVGGLGRATATLIAPSWALTANHVVNGYDRPSFEPPVMTLRFGDREVAVEAMFRPPFRTAARNDGGEVLEPDLALVRLAQEVHEIAPLPIYRGRDEVGRRVILVGYGQFGRAGDETLREYGIPAAATNTIAEADDDWLRFRFDVGHGATELEGVAAAGDSGGPALITREGEVFVAGVSSHSNPRGTPHSDSGAPGVWEGYARVSSSAAWIDQTMAAVDAGRSSTSELIRPDAPARPAAEGLPPTAAGKLARGFLDAYNSGDEETFVHWSREHARHPRPDRAYAERFGRYRARYGDRLHALRSKNLSPEQILLEVRSTSGLREEMLIVVEAVASPKVLTFGFRLLEEP